MKRLHPDKLYVEYRDGVSMTETVEDRKYTLTHSDLTADLFLTMGLEYAYDKINAMRDEVLGEWRTKEDGIFLYVYVYVDGEYDPEVAAVRNSIFRRELPLALEAIRYGDRGLFHAHPNLDNAPIWIQFDSTNPEYNRFENWGTPFHYK